MKKMRGLEWTPEEVQKLKLLAQEKAGLSKISSSLKRAPSTVIAAAEKHGIQPTLRG